jgi:hypothetical protein
MTSGGSDGRTRPGDAWLSSFGTPQRPRKVDGHGLWPGPAGWSVAALRAPRRVDYVLVCPKTTPLDWWWAAGPPTGVAAVYSLYLADPRLAPTLRSLCPPGRPAVFIGDLDPVGVAQYLAAKAMLASDGITLLYGGINDSWLAAIRRSRRRRGPMGNLCLRLDRAETRLWRRLEAAMDVEQLVGPESCHLLRSGDKLELEAASNPGILRPGHRRWVFRHLRAMALGGNT